MAGVIEPSWNAWNSRSEKERQSSPILYWFSKDQWGHKERRLPIILGNRHSRQATRDTILHYVRSQKRVLISTVNTRHRLHCTGKRANVISHHAFWIALRISHILAIVCSWILYLDLHSNRTYSYIWTTLSSSVEPLTNTCACSLKFSAAFARPAFAWIWINAVFAWINSSTWDM